MPFAVEYLKSIAVITNLNEEVELIDNVLDRVNEDTGFKCLFDDPE